ncbi:hypothetical protein BGW36DRAFT_424698 [Talaromyces proteolyticus]|uniref:Uncharacterized protein n=1 Tax=Talaromyces proteolyticus TaxID=1131652 RepID=A0AAD4KZI1_9EURO|nr:uncharacterized protein BGW36DRAFT_424698 [Talaromyces proteolyticus]KAH8702422.1 hypothetical protein BGW36DRAFT_424698 [Talaromyces proteolyticus]
MQLLWFVFFPSVNAHHSLGSVQPAIEVQKIRFVGTLDFAENSTLIQTFWDPNAPRYTGEPSDESDARWHSLYQASDGVDLRGDMLRQALRPDYYTRHYPESSYTTHIHHCLDHIRQAVMCHVDVTPLPVLWAEQEERPLNDFQVEHTYRNFWKKGIFTLLPNFIAQSGFPNINHHVKMRLNTFLSAMLSMASFQIIAAQDFCEGPGGEACPSGLHFIGTCDAGSQACTDPTNTYVCDCDLNKQVSHITESTHLP